MLGTTTLALIRLALEEDLGAGDLTTKATIGEFAEGCAVIVAKEKLVVCGHELASAVFAEVDRNLRYLAVSPEGSRVCDGAVLSSVEGPLRSLLAAERVVLNFMQRLSGISTLTAHVVERIQQQRVRVLDTRKTTPGWRELEKYAVRVGGGANHRFGLYDAVLIKNNHIDALGGDIAAAVRLSRMNTAPGTKVEVEVRSFAELDQAVTARPDAILFDNMSPEDLRSAVQRVRKAQDAQAIELEASGGIDEINVCDYADTGVDCISLGMLTHSVRAVDIALHYQGRSSGGSSQIQ